MARIPYALLFLAFLLIYIPRVIVITVLVKQPGGLDNNNPRDQQALLTGYGKRAQGAHLNMFEAFPIFAAGILASLVGHVRLDFIVALGTAFIFLRVVYIALYLGDKASARTLVWMVANGISASLILAPLFLGA